MRIETVFIHIVGGFRAMRRRDLLITGVAVFLVCIPIYWFLANEMALRIAKRECSHLRQVEIVDRNLWDKAVIAAHDKEYPDRTKHRFYVKYQKFSDLKQDVVFRPLYRSVAPVSVNGKLVAYRNNVYVYPYGMGEFIMGGFSLPLYHCTIDRRNMSRDNMIIANFNQFGG